MTMTAVDAEHYTQLAYELWGRALEAYKDRYGTFETDPAKRAVGRWYAAVERRGNWRMNWLRPVKSIRERQRLDATERTLRWSALPYLQQKGLI